ncbi:uncharacterized protein [Ptychodera flava]|uniref:uncharacterized protein n=1 Tax=Ptychodera flava TaxID=63121 RepID=UPI003969FAF1
MVRIAAICLIVTMILSSVYAIKGRDHKREESLSLYDTLSGNDKDITHKEDRALKSPEERDAKDQGALMRSLWELLRQLNEDNNMSETIPVSTLKKRSVDS